MRFGEIGILPLKEVIWAMPLSANYAYITQLDYIVRLLIDRKWGRLAKFQRNPPGRSSGNRRNRPLLGFLFLRLTSEGPHRIG
jgi:hypothetical protein